MDLSNPSPEQVSILWRSYEEHVERTSLYVEALSRAAKGAALLDSKKPAWWELIKTKIDTRSTRFCTLGQVYGDYDCGVANIKPKTEWEAVHTWSIEHGFDENVFAKVLCWSYLDEAWQQLVLERIVASEAARYCSQVLS